MWCLQPSRFLQIPLCLSFLFRSQLANFPSSIYSFYQRKGTLHEGSHMELIGLLYSEAIQFLWWELKSSMVSKDNFHLSEGLKDFLEKN